VGATFEPTGRFDEILYGGDDIEGDVDHSKMANV
jgi:hypothetical protein